MKPMIAKIAPAAFTSLSLCLFAMTLGACAVSPELQDQPQQSIADQPLVDKNIIVPWSGQRVGAQTLLKMTTHGGTIASSSDANEVLDLTIRLSIKAFVHCYYRTPNRVIYRILPTSMDSMALFSAGKSMVLPVHSRVRTLPKTDQERESFLCLASDENLAKKLPVFVTASGVTGLPEVDFDTLFRIYQSVTNKNLIGRTLVHDISEQ